MKVYTIQVAKWRKARDKGILFIDSTVKTGFKELAPTWDMVMGYKNGSVSEEKYSELYKSIVDKSIVENSDFWNDLINNDTVAIACYCQDGHFCHRYQLLNPLEQYCIQQGVDFEYMGELK